MANEKQIDKICRMLDDLITKSKRDTNSEPAKEQLKSPDFYEGYKIGFESAQPKWISVEERLPLEDETVLTYRDGCCGVARLLDVEPVIMWTYAGFGGDPTHWMPLPEPPKEK